jgi:hypothetical protein
MDRQGGATDQDPVALVVDRFEPRRACAQKNAMFGRGFGVYDRD